MSQVIPNTRRGVALHKENPFISNAAANTKQGVKRIASKTGNKMMVVNHDTGEVVSPAGFWQTQEVDKTKFVKLYVEGVRAFKELTGAGTKVFEVLYLRVQEGIGKDQVFMAYPSLDQNATPMSFSTYKRGMAELIEKGFIAATPIQGWFWLNPDYMWNGDRLAFVREYRLAKAMPSDVKQREQLEEAGQQRLID